MVAEDGKIGSGHVVAERYRLLEKLGQGGMGSVWTAEHLSLKSQVAVKFIVGESVDDETARARFMREAQAAAALKSTHVVRITDYGVDDKHPYIVMELLEGESLARRLGREVSLSPSEVLEIFRQMARAVSKAHAAGIVHRDLKPDNVFIVDEGDVEVVKVLDFGVAKQVHESISESSPRTATGALMGTPFYMSPEQMRSKPDVDARADVWAMGVMAYECLLGSRPFDAETLPELVLAVCVQDRPMPSDAGEVPDGFDEWFERATARDPDRRFQDVQEMTTALAAVVGDAGEVGEKVRLSSKRPKRRRSSGPTVRDTTEPIVGDEDTVFDPKVDRTRLEGANTEAGAAAEMTARGASPEGSRSPWTIPGLLALIAGLAVAAWIGTRTTPEEGSPPRSVEPPHTKPLADPPPVTVDEMPMEPATPEVDAAVDAGETARPSSRATPPRQKPRPPKSAPKPSAKPAKPAKPRIDLGL